MIRFIGDVHGKLGDYVTLAHEADYSICVGDVGMNYSFIKNYLDPTKHRCIGGNHDNYALENGEFAQSPHFLGDFGVHTIPNFTDIFFVRGAWSIDREFQEKQGTWFTDEQLTHDKRVEALELYKSVKPDYMLTHTCPLSVIEFIGNPDVTEFFGYDDPVIPTWTNSLLEEMLEFHQPKWWVFGHFHVNRTLLHRGTIFSCIDELSVLDFQDYSNLQEWIKNELV